MVCTTRTGAATGAGSLSYATYVIAATLEVENQRAALYYAGDREGRDYPEPAIYLKPDLTAGFAARLGIDRGAGAGRRARAGPQPGGDKLRRW